MNDASVFICPWCLRESAHPIDLKYGYCTCCGDETMSRHACEHRTKSTLTELFGRGVRLVRRDPWSDGSYLELQESGGFMTPFGLVHSPLEWDGVPAAVALAAQAVPLWRTPRGGWEPYTGPTVEQRGARKDVQDA